MLDPNEFGKAMAAIVREATAPLLKRIEQLEARQPERGAKGEDGASITVADVTPLIAELIQKAVAAMPAPKDGVDGINGTNGVDGASVTLEQTAALVDKAVAAAIEKIPAPKDGINGTNGKDAEPIDMADVVRELAASPEVRTVMDLLAAESVAKHFQLNPVRDGRDGRDGTNGKDAVGKDGAKGDKGDAGADGIGLAGAMIDREGCLIVTTTKGDPIKLGLVIGKDGERGKDGADFSEATIEYDGRRTLTIRGKGGEITKRLPIPLDAGYWRDGMALEKGDIVTHNGTAWIALADTKSKPCHENKDDWRLFARGGRDGTDGTNGRNLGPAPPVKLGGSNA